MTEAQRQIAQAKAENRKRTGEKPKREAESGGGISGKPIPPLVYRSGACVVRVEDYEGTRLAEQGGIATLEGAVAKLRQAAADRTVKGITITIERAT